MLGYGRQSHTGEKLTCPCPLAVLGDSRVHVSVLMTSGGFHVRTRLSATPKSVLGVGYAAWGQGEGDVPERATASLGGPLQVNSACQRAPAWGGGSRPSSLYGRGPGGTHSCPRRVHGCFGPQSAQKSSTYARTGKGTIPSEECARAAEMPPL